jgi:predicted O-methyltransferase YrrM
MIDHITQSIPASYDNILRDTKNLGFTMASEIKTCSLLRTLAASKPGSKFLELGTGTGLSTAWILDGMDARSHLTSIDFDENLLAIARLHIGNDHRLSLVCTDGAEWVNANKGSSFDYIFADTWHGKYLLLDEVLAMLKPGGLYIIDDMLTQPNWPDGHEEKVDKLLQYLDSRTDLVLTRQGWASGLVIAVKR